MQHERQCDLGRGFAVYEQSGGHGRWGLEELLEVNAAIRAEAA